METVLVKVLPLVFSLASVGLTAVVKYQLEKAKHQFEVQSQFHLETHKKIWGLWEVYYSLTGTLEQMLSRNCEDNLEDYASFYEEIVQQKRLLAPVISSQLDKALEQFLEIYHPLSVCNGTNESYQKLYGRIVNQFREALK